MGGYYRKNFIKCCLGTTNDKKKTREFHNVPSKKIKRNILEGILDDLTFLQIIFWSLWFLKNRDAIIIVPVLYTVHLF